MTHYLRNSNNDTLLEIEVISMEGSPRAVMAGSVDLRQFGKMLLDLRFSRQQQFMDLMGQLQEIQGTPQEGVGGLADWSTEETNAFVAETLRSVCTEWELNYMTD